MYFFHVFLVFKMDSGNIAKSRTGGSHIFMQPPLFILTKPYNTE